MAVMNSTDFINKLKHIASLPTTYYSVAGGDWAKWNGWSWNFDCVILVKAILWGWNENKNHPHGGANYGSNGVFDDNTEQIINRCSERSADFRNITPGELLWMPGHVGVYIGNGQVIECTAAWESKVVYSSIDGNGVRSRNGNVCYQWKQHGKLPYIEYNSEPTPIPSSEVNVFYRVKTRENGWLDEVRNLEDYAGLDRNSIIDIMVRVDKGSVWYQAHVKGKGWLPKVTGYNTDDYFNGYAGDDINPIDCVRVYYETPDDIIRTSGYKRAKYRINNLPWVYDTERCPNGDDFAGNMGENAYKLEIVIE